MNKEIYDFANTIKNIKNIGFTYREAKDIYEYYVTRLQNIFLFNEVFEFDNDYTTNATDCYNTFVKFCVENKVDVPTQTAFGINMSKFAKKIRTNSGYIYNVKIKENRRI
ncbi:hypothetical protein CG018_07650 [Gemella sp. ND 6198]|uniref:hypothetical protein n=1 Tax=Gemella sp. ND 6198 TaxID=2040624 RepID=UPI000E0B908E|nr:hypothetical protein [Gemella sp. ND 6198]AXI27285.1 hypothetical protein CG018_07650 [Gemella sp. ND 6198]